MTKLMWQQTDIKLHESFDRPPLSTDITLNFLRSEKTFSARRLLNPTIYWCLLLNTTITWLLFLNITITWCLLLNLTITWCFLLKPTITWRVFLNMTIT